MGHSWYWLRTLFSLDKIALLTHFPSFYFLFPTKSYFTNILPSTFFHFTNINLFPFNNIKEKKRWRNINKRLRNNNQGTKKKKKKKKIPLLYFSWFIVIFKKYVKINMLLIFILIHVYCSTNGWGCSCKRLL